LRTRSSLHRPACAKNAFLRRRKKIFTAPQKNLRPFPRRIFSRREKFPVKKIFVPVPLARRRSVFRGEIDYPKIYFVGSDEFVLPFSLSTQKVTENLQIGTALHLTVISAIPIGCGQGSGHPHPVVVDNVLESFGNFVSPRLFPRL
jgi:hypothetical protein